MNFSRDFKFQPGNRVAREFVLEAASRGFQFHLSSNHAMRVGKGVGRCRICARDLESATAGPRADSR